MSFGGSAMSMIASLKHNKRTRTSRFDKNGTPLTESGYGEFTDHKTISKEDLAKLRQKLIQEKKQTLKKQVLVFGSIMLVIIAVFWWLMF